MSTDLPPLPPITPGRYRHYKGLDYEVLGVVRHSETLEPLVLYRPLYNDSGQWVRPYAMFTEMVEVQGRRQPRFEFQASLPKGGPHPMRLVIANKHYSSWSLRPWVLLKQLGVPFEEVLVPFGPDSAAAFRAHSPTGKVPCLVDGDTVVWDSLAIVEYLAERVPAAGSSGAAPAVWPQDHVARAWARSACAEMHSGFAAVRHYCSMSCGLRVRLHPLPPAQAAELAAQWARIDALWCEGLSRFGGPFLAGAAFTAVDAFYAPMAFRVQTYSPDLSAPSQAYVQRLLALPAMQQWYRDALDEPWRDEPHEQSIGALGEVLRDERTRVP